MFKVIVFILLSISLNASSIKEKDYINKYCEGKKEFILSDKTRIDCLTSDVAYEFDFAHKFYEAIGQSLYYAIKTNRQAGIYIIVNKLEDNRYVIRLKEVCEKYNIKLNVIYDLKDR